MVEQQPFYVFDFNSARQTLLHVAVIRGHDSVVQFLIDKHSDLDAVDHYERTPLFYAVSAGRISLIKLLLANGASPWSCSGQNFLAMLKTAECIEDLAKYRKLWIRRKLMSISERKLLKHSLHSK